MNFFKKLFKRSKRTVTDYVDPKTGEVTKSAVQIGKRGERFLKLNDGDCGFVIHSGGKVEVIFTKLYNTEDQQVTIEEETLMALAVFLKQKGFAEMIRHEFHKLAMNDLNSLTEDIDKE